MKSLELTEALVELKRLSKENADLTFDIQIKVITRVQINKVKYDYSSKTHQVHRVVEDCCQVLGTNLLEIKRKTKKYEIIKKKFLVYYILNEDYGLSEKEIANFFGLDRTTPYNGLKVARKAIKQDNDFISKYHEVLKYLGKEA